MIVKLVKGPHQYSWPIVEIVCQEILSGLGWRYDDCDGGSDDNDDNVYDESYDDDKDHDAEGKDEDDDDDDDMYMIAKCL